MPEPLQLVIDADHLNAAKPNYRGIGVRPLGGALGAEIDGVDLSKKLDPDTLAEIRRALLDHLVIFFDDQQITPEQHKAFGRHFGEFHTHPYVSGTLDGHDDIIVVHKTPSDKLNFGGTWHSDVTFEENPPLGSILYALQVPDYGGDTIFANQYLAYEMLSDGMQQMISGLRAWHSAERVYGTQGAYAGAEYRSGMSGTGTVPSADAERAVLHPVVRTHPETGRKALFVNKSFTQRFENMTTAESRGLLDFLCEHAATEDFTCRFRWRPGALAFWDNRCTMHYALNDYPGQTRLMHRLTVCGDRPV